MASLNAGEFKPLPLQCLFQIVCRIQVKLISDRLTTWNKFMMNDTILIKDNG